MHQLPTVFPNSKRSIPQGAHIYPKFHYRLEPHIKSYLITITCNKSEHDHKNKEINTDLKEIRCAVKCKSQLDGYLCMGILKFDRFISSNKISSIDYLKTLGCEFIPI